MGQTISEEKEKTVQFIVKRAFLVGTVDADEFWDLLNRNEKAPQAKRFDWRELKQLTCNRYDEEFERVIYFAFNIAAFPTDISCSSRLSACDLKMEALR